jgi:hypothetical protein
MNEFKIISVAEVPVFTENRLSWQYLFEVKHESGHVATKIINTEKPLSIKIKNPIIK